MRGSIQQHRSTEGPLVNQIKGQSYQFSGSV